MTSKNKLNVNDILKNIFTIRDWELYIKIISDNWLPPDYVKPSSDDYWLNSVVYIDDNDLPYIIVNYE